MDLGCPYPSRLEDPIVAKKLGVLQAKPLLVGTASFCHFLEVPLFKFEAPAVTPMLEAAGYRVQLTMAITQATPAVTPPNANPGTPKGHDVPTRRKRMKKPP